MNKKKVVDLEHYRVGEPDLELVSEPRDQSLRPGTGLLYGQYTILSQINAGGFGITYLANDSLGRKVAIKECFPDALCERSGNEMQARTAMFKGELDEIVGHFLTEAQRLASLTHQSIVHVHQIFEENATAYMAMDYIEGSDLLELVEGATDNLQTPTAVQSLTEQLLHAVAYVHDAGFLHRDLAPDNIMVRPDNTPVLIDFGTARQITHKVSERPSRLKFVKDGYSPQEFYHPEAEQGPFSDLYALGATLHHLIAGQPPVDAETRLAAVKAAEPDPYQPLDGRFAGYRPCFLKAVDKALAVLPEDRVQSAEDWLDMIRKKSHVKIMSEIASRTVESVGSTLVTGPAANNPKLVKGALAALAVFTLTAAGMVGWDRTSKATELALVPVAISVAPDQPTIASLEARSDTAVSEIARVDKSVLRQGIAQIPNQEDSAPVAIAAIEKIEIQVTDILVAPIPPSIEQNGLSVFEHEHAPVVAKSVPFPRVSGFEGASPTSVQQTHDAFAPLPVVVEATANVRTAKINEAPRAKSMVALSDFEAHTQNTAFGRPIPLPQINLVSSFEDLAAPDVPTSTREGLTAVTSVPVERRVAYLPVAFMLREQPFNGDVAPPVFDWQWAARQRNR